MDHWGVWIRIRIRIDIFGWIPALKEHRSVTLMITYPHTDPLLRAFISYFQDAAPPKARTDCSFKAYKRLQLEVFIPPLGPDRADSINKEQQQRPDR
jgi:hypothetical protein